MQISDIGVYLTSTITWLVALVCYVTFYSYLKLPGKYKSGEIFVFMAFWVSVGSSWLFAGVDEFAIAAKNMLVAGIMYHIAIVFVALSLVSGFWYYSLVLFKKVARRIVITLVAADTLVFMYVHFYFGIFERPSNLFSLHFTLNIYASMVFLSMIIPGTFVITAEIIRLYRKRYMYAISNKYRFSVWAVAAFLVTTLGSTADLLGFASDWIVTLIRILAMFAAFLAFIAVYELSYSERDLVM